MIETSRRPTRALALSIAVVGLAFATAARAQVGPGGGVQTMGPSSPIPPQLPPSAFAPGSGAGGGPSDAPLASSAEDCQSDISRISSQRLSAIDGLNKIAKANKGRLDPIAACPRFKTLVKIETEFRDYLIKNKDWCNVPDNVIDTVEKSTAKDSAISVKACGLAVQFRKAQEEAAQGLAAQAPKLPTGPL